LGEPLEDQSRIEADTAALELFNREFRGSLTRYFHRRMPADQVEDMVQDVFLRLFQRGNIAELEFAAGYVFRTANSVLRDRLRKRLTHCEDDHCSFDPMVHGDADFSPEDVLLGKERLARATAILLELPERSRVVFVLRRIEDMTYQEIAAKLGLSVSAIEKIMLHSVRYLARRMDEQ
jgi:RNA polymerase sigma-70 factor (ECF subfamily)